MKLFEEYLEEKSFVGRAWAGKIGNIDDLLSWMYRKDILGPYDKKEKDRMFTAYYRFYNDGDEPTDIERMAGETYADALEREIEEFIKEILSSYAGKYDRRTFRFDKLLGELKSLQNQLHFKDRTGNNDKEWEKKMSYDINGFIYFYKKLGKLGNPQFDNLVANIDKTFKAWEKEADKEIEKTLKKKPKLGDWDKGLSTNLIFGAKYAKMQEFSVVTPKIEKLYNTVKEIGDELHAMIGDIIEATERAKDTLQENVEVKESHVLEFQEYLNEKYSDHDVMNYVLAQGTISFKNYGISDKHRKEIFDMIKKIMNKVGDRGSSVIGSGLYVNDEKWLKAYSQGNIGPEQIYREVEKFLNKNYPDLDVYIDRGNMD